ncbi:AMP-binding protein [Longispora albida]|uniref:AMP-binding protein n=1 Tax=Longispora albida TaxID=203523 RepID=UPI00037877C4|nr:AMP-binding protein [Longispora albida]
MRLVADSARVIDAATGAVLTGADLSPADLYDAVPPGAVFARTGQTVAAVRRYLGAFAAGRPVALLDPALAPETLAELVRRFEPAVVTGIGEGGAGADPGELPKGYVTGDVLGEAWIRENAPEHQPHPDLGVLLATSGSTGDPKLVRLSRQAIVHNAGAIAEVLGITDGEVAPTSLPLFYSFGMSVLNSHLAAGATVLVIEGGVLAREFWAAFDQYEATSLAGVPYSYEMLSKIRWTPAKHPSLRTLTQAGGKLRDELIEKFSGLSERFYVMWGQTEAGPRMTTLPADKLAAKLGSVGLPLPGGAVSIEDGEVVYRGPNVMMGYAETAADLARGDDEGGVLRTGDIGHVDEDGFLWLKGRTKRFGKIFGVRVNLADIEALVTGAGEGPVAAVSGSECVVVHIEGVDAGRAKEIQSLLAERLKLHRTGFDVRPIDRLPLLSNGKINYRELS